MEDQALETVDAYELRDNDEFPTPATPRYVDSAYGAPAFDPVMFMTKFMEGQMLPRKMLADTNGKNRRTIEEERERKTRKLAGKS